MRLLRFFSWIVAALTMMAAVGSSIHTIFNYLMPALGISGNRAVAGGYTMELVVSAVAFVMVLWRLLWALEIVATVGEAFTLLRTRTAILTTALAGLIAMDFTVRFFWWHKRMFGEQVFENAASYTAAANSAITSMVLCVVVYALHAAPDHVREKSHVRGYPLGLPTALMLWSTGWVAFFIGMMAYQAH